MRDIYAIYNLVINDKYKIIKLYIRYRAICIIKIKIRILRLIL